MYTPGQRKILAGGIVVPANDDDSRVGSGTHPELDITGGEVGDGAGRAHIDVMPIPVNICRMLGKCQVYQA